jgi:uncharacterized protein (DUF305 family)
VHGNSYGRLAIMTVLSFLSMYILMYSMVDRFGNVYNNLNQVYMAGLMASPMVIIELLLMNAMYENAMANRIILALSVVALVAFFAFIRWQTAITDRQFLRSMIPHHGGAILMCREAPIQDAGIKDLCQRIIASQQSEIDEMEAKLVELNR